LVDAESAALPWVAVVVGVKRQAVVVVAVGAEDGVQAGGGVRCAAAVDSAGRAAVVEPDAGTVIVGAVAVARILFSMFNVMTVAAMVVYYRGRIFTSS
jgi:hypothetical protein